MKEDDLNNPAAPAKLNELNIQIFSEIELALSSTGNDHSQLFALIDERDKVVLSILESLKGDNRKRFAQKEATTNDFFLEQCVRLKSSAIADTRSFLNKRNAIKKYT